MRALLIPETAPFALPSAPIRSGPRARCCQWSCGHSGITSGADAGGAAGTAPASKGFSRNRSSAKPRSFPTCRLISRPPVGLYGAKCASSRAGLL
ncbi:hypothetical protein G6F57_018935 [Rhizopus arrhizus]|nr:hypothetical protein G6F57_018935 [Rhizopus arrhizus]